MRRRISAFFSIRKRLPFKIFGATVSENIRIPANPLVALGAMIWSGLSRKPKKGKTNG